MDPKSNLKALTKSKPTFRTGTTKRSGRFNSFSILKAFAGQPQIDEMRAVNFLMAYLGEKPKGTFQSNNTELAEPREKYNQLMAQPEN